MVCQALIEFSWKNFEVSAFKLLTFQTFLNSTIKFFIRNKVEFPKYFEAAIVNDPDKIHKLVVNHSCENLW